MDSNSASRWIHKFEPNLDYNHLQSERETEREKWMRNSSACTWHSLEHGDEYIRENSLLM